MALSKSNRIVILLVIDSLFFLLELIIGSAVHSLALVADSFHMLNDVLSLCVGLWAVGIADDRKNPKMYTYGWQRAETLGALINGVFLVALCLSIFLEAIQRFAEPQPISNPLLVLCVGSCGLLANILGLLLFHEHSHSHSHSHSHGGEHGTPAAAEEGHVYGTFSTAEDHRRSSLHRGENLIEGISRSEDSAGQMVGTSHAFNKSDEDGSTVAYSDSPVTPRKRRHTGLSAARYSTSEEINVHPATFRNGIIAQSRLEDTSSILDSDSEPEETIGEGEEPAEETTLLGRHRSNGSKNRAGSPSHAPKHEPHKHDESLHQSHKHNQPKKAAKGSGNLNTRGVFLHVIGDALGNVGVMVSALIVRYFTSPLTLYADPVISLVITCIILGSAIPLCKAASRILLQAVPAGMNVDDIKEDIAGLPGILSCHHLHVWQLSDTKLVASLHIAIKYDIKGEGSARYMELAQAVRSCLHGYGIHSSTIQPEFCVDREQRSGFRQMSNLDGEGSHRAVGSPGGFNVASAGGSKPSSMRGEPDACLLQCGVECDERGQCCLPGLEDSEARDEGS